MNQFSPDATRRIIGAVKKAERTPVRIGAVSRIAPRELGSMIGVKNSENRIIPAGGVMEPTSYSTTTGLISVRRPTEDSLGFVLLAAHEIAANGTGGAWTDGIRSITVSGTPSFGDRLGSTEDSYHAQEDGAGPLVYLGSSYAMFQSTGGRPAYGDATIGSQTLSETASAVSWQREATPVGETFTFIFMPRWTYSSSGNQTLYGFFRAVKMDALGLYSISAETRVTIDTPGECS